MSTIKVNKTVSSFENDLLYDFEIQQPRAKVSKVTLVKRANGDIFIRAIFNSKYQAQIFWDYCTNKDIPVSHSLSDNCDVNFTTRNPQEAAYLIEQFSSIDRYSHAYISDVLDVLSTQPVKKLKMPSWVKSGNFEVPLNYGYMVLIDREVTFQRTAKNSPVQSLSLNSYKDDGYCVVIEFKSTKAFDKFKQMLEEYGFPSPDNTYRSIKHVFFWNHDKKLIAQFLKLFSNFEPAFDYIQSEAAQTLGLDFAQPLQKHRTMLVGDFAKPFFSGGSLNRKLKLHLTQPKKQVQAIELYGYNDGSIRINLCFANVIYKKLFATLTRNMMRHLKRTEFAFDQSICFEIPGTDKTKMLLALGIAKFVVGETHASDLAPFYRALKLPEQTLAQSLKTIAILNEEFDKKSSQHLVLKLNKASPKQDKRAAVVSPLTQSNQIRDTLLNAISGLVKQYSCTSPVMTAPNLHQSQGSPKPPITHHLTLRLAANLIADNGSNVKTVPSSQTGKSHLRLSLKKSDDDLYS